MGADIKKIRTRIKSVNSTLHLTKAMGLVASSKIRRANEAMAHGREYEEAVKEVIIALSGSKECEKSPYMEKREGTKTHIVCIAGDRGLAGGYNQNCRNTNKDLLFPFTLPLLQSLIIELEIPAL